MQTYALQHIFATIFFKRRNITKQTHNTDRNITKPSKYSNHLMTTLPLDVKHCIILLNLRMTLSSSTAKCEWGLSLMNHIKSSAQTCNETTVMKICSKSCSSFLEIAKIWPMQINYNKPSEVTSLNQQESYAVIKKEPRGVEWSSIQDRRTSLC